MPAQFTLPPDTRAIGTGNPPQDMNGVVDALTAMGAPGNVLSTAFSGGADPTGTAASDSAFAAAVTNFQSTGQPVIVPPGTYKFTGTLDWRVPGLQVFGAGKQNTKLVQHTANTQIVRLAGAHQRISGLQFQYSSQQSTASANAIGVSFGDDSIGSCFESIFEDWYIVNANYGIAIDPSVASVGGIFSCVIRSVRISQNGGTSGISVVASNGSGADITGNKWEAIYVSNNWNGTQSTWAGHPVAFQGCDNDHFSVFNVEHGNAYDGDVMAFTDCYTTLIDDLHIESVPVSGTPGFGFILANASTVNIRGMHVRGCTLTGTSQNPVVRFGGSSTGNRVRISGYSQVTNTVSTAHPWADFNSATSSSLTIQDVTSTQVTACQVNGAAGDKLSGGNPQGYIDYAPAGALAETFPRLNATTAVTPASGTLMVRMISLSAGLPVTSATFVTNSTVKTGGTHGWYVLLDLNRKVLAVTADQTDPATVWGTANTPYPLNFGAVFTPAYDGEYLLGVMVAESAGTMPNFAAAPSPTGGINGTLTPIMSGASSTGQTTPPAVGATMTGLSSAGADNLYAYVS